MNSVLVNVLKQLGFVRGRRKSVFLMKGSPLTWTQMQSPQQRPIVRGPVKKRNSIFEVMTKRGGWRGTSYNKVIQL